MKDTKYCFYVRTVDGECHAIYQDKERLTLDGKVGSSWEWLELDEMESEGAFLIIFKMHIVSIKRVTLKARDKHQNPNNYPELCNPCSCHD